VSEILARDKVVQSLGAMGDPEWHLTDSYRTLLLAHDAAMRAENRALAERGRVAESVIRDAEDLRRAADARVEKLEAALLQIAAGGGSADLYERIAAAALEGKP
jgi:hypothetical protein